MADGSNQSRRSLRAAWRGSTLFPEVQWKAIAELLALSSRELQVVQLLVDHLTEQSIARELGISRHTVHTHVCNIYRKLDVGSRCELLARVIAEHRALNTAADGKCPEEEWQTGCGPVTIEPMHRPITRSRAR